MYISQGQEQVDHITNEVKHNIEERCSTMKFGLDALATGHCVTLNEHLEQNLENVRRETSRQRPMFCLITPTSPRRSFGATGHSIFQVSTGVAQFV